MIRPGPLSSSDAADLNAALDKLAALDRISVVPPATLRRGPGGQPVIGFPALADDWFFAEIKGHAGTTTTPGAGEVDGDKQKYSWVERVEAGVAGVWADGDRSGGGTDDPAGSDAYLAEASAGAGTTAVANGALVLMRANPDGAGYEFTKAGGDSAFDRTLNLLVDVCPTWVWLRVESGALKAYMNYVAGAFRVQVGGRKTYRSLTIPAGATLGDPKCSTAGQTCCVVYELACDCVGCTGLAKMEFNAEQVVENVVVPDQGPTFTGSPKTAATTVSFWFCGPKNGTANLPWRVQITDASIANYPSFGRYISVNGTIKNLPGPACNMEAASALNRGNVSWAQAGLGIPFGQPDGTVAATPACWQESPSAGCFTYRIDFTIQVWQSGLFTNGDPVVTFNVLIDGGSCS